MQDNQIDTPAQEPSEIQPPAEEETLSAKPARSKKWFFIGGALFVFLVAAAFLGARLLKPQQETGLGGEGPMLFTSGGGPGGGGKSLSLSITPAKEVPQEKATTTGLFVRREDQSIFIGTGNVRMMVKKGADGNGSKSSSYDGPVMEVVITHTTKVYQDITDMNPGNLDAKNGGEMKLQQIVKEGSLDDLEANSLVSVWGDEQGDRYIARVVVFR